MTQFKVFCVLCDWSAFMTDEGELWSRYATCPQCQGPTDATRMDRQKYFPKRKLTE